MAGAGEKAFCAGGDVAALALQNQQGAEGQALSKAYFTLEYQLDHLIATYQKPYIAYMDGITMGGGVGLSVHAPFRIATERTVFAMPETTIGFFPDVGGSFFLPRLDGAIGTYLALTSERLKGVQAFYAGIATHYIDSSSLGPLTARLAELVFKDYISLPDRLTAIAATIEEFNTGLPYDEPIFLAGALRQAIDRCFSADNIEGILAALESETGATQPWAQQTLETLAARSPTSLRVTLKQMRLGRNWTIADAFQREHFMAGRFMAHPDFVSGVTARLIEKPPRTPTWTPASLDAVSDKEVESFFLVEGKQRFPLVSNGPDYGEYPHAGLGLPREVEVERFVGAGGRERSEVVDFFVGMRRGKVGVREKVEEILDRMTVVGKDGLHCV
jgi:3-hydroxyisobutyryl-CoA hydrolase